MPKIDRIGNVLHEGDRVVAYSYMRTGSSTRRMVQYDGIIVGFNKSYVRVRCIENTYDALDKEFNVQCRNIFKVVSQEANNAEN